jgi:hypothetical protein
MNITASPKLCIGADDLDYLLGALRGREGELDLAGDHEVKAVRQIAALEQHLAAGDLAVAGVARDQLDVRLRQFAEQRDAAQQGGDVERGRVGHLELSVWGRNFNSAGCRAAPWPAFVRICGCTT